MNRNRDFGSLSTSTDQLVGGGTMLRWTYVGTLLALTEVISGGCARAPQKGETSTPKAGELIEPEGRVLFQEDFKDLSNWHHEGVGRAYLSKPGVLRLECVGSQQGGAGSQVFCRQDFPDHIAVEFDLRVLTNNGLIITFVAMKGLHGEDMIVDLPPRQELFKEYTGADARLRSYHVSVSRYDDTGRHTGVSNWRRNPGAHLMAQGLDLCQEIGRWYRIRIVKDGPHLQLGVNGQLAHEFTDPTKLPTPMPSNGKVGFRAIGANVHALIRDFRVLALRNP